MDRIFTSVGARMHYAPTDFFIPRLLAAKVAT